MLEPFAFHVLRNGNVSGWPPLMYRRVPSSRAESAVFPGRFFVIHLKGFRFVGSIAAFDATPQGPGWDVILVEGTGTMEARPSLKPDGSWKTLNHFVRYPIEELTLERPHQRSIAVNRDRGAS